MLGTSCCHGSGILTDVFLEFLINESKFNAAIYTFSGFFFFHCYSHVSGIESVFISKSLEVCTVLSVFIHFC